MFQTWRSLSASGREKDTLFRCCSLLGFCFHERRLPLVGRLRHTAYLFLPVRYTHTRNTRLSLGCFLHLIDGSLAATFFFFFCEFNPYVFTFLIIPTWKKTYDRIQYGDASIVTWKLYQHWPLHRFLERFLDSWNSFLKMFAVFETV